MPNHSACPQPADHRSVDSQALHEYQVALQNFRGLLGRQRLAQLQTQRRALGTDPSSVATYAITGLNQLKPERLVPASPKLTALAQQVLVSLCALVHHSLRATDPRSFKLVVGLSGGADSALVLVLAAKLQELYGYQVQAVHCIHGLDPDDAIWLEHNQALCQLLGVELATSVLNIVYGGGVSPEDASRQERYRALLTATQASNEAALLLGHQADDQIESFLLALKRGSGPVGLAGMQFIVRDQRGTILRPLLDLHKDEVEQILRLLDLPYVYDLSNSYLKFERNFVRLKVLPLFKERFPGVEGAILRSQKLCRYEHDLAQRLVTEQLAQLRKDRYTLDFAQLDLNDRALATILVRTFITEAIGSSCEFNIVEQALALMAAGHDRNGLITLNGKWALSTFLHYLCVYEPLSAPDEASLTGTHELKLGQVLRLGPYCYELVPAAQKEVQGRNCPYFGLAGTSVYLDFDYARGQALKLKGRACSRPIKKLMIEAEIAPWQRAALPLIKDESGKVLALGGVGAVAGALESVEGALESVEGALDSASAPRYELRINKKAPTP